MKLFLLAALFSILIPSCLLNGQSSSGVYIQSEIGANTPYAHDYAMSKIKAYEDYQKQKHGPPEHFFKYMFNSGKSVDMQEFSVSDGEIKLENISLEDAFLLLYSNEVEKAMSREKDWDAIQTAMKNIPPKKFILDKHYWTVEDTPDWSKGKILGDTTCGLQRVRVLATNLDKEGTVMHELMHVASGCEDNAELHSLITKMAPKLLVILQENSDLTAYLTSNGQRKAEKNRRRLVRKR